MERDTDKRIKVPKKTYNKQKKIVLIMLTLIVVVVATLIAYTIAMKDIVKKWDNKIYPGVTVQGMDIGGMTKEEAKSKLTDTFEMSIQNKKLPIKIGDKQYELIYSDIIPKYDINMAIEEAYKFGKENGIFNKYLSIKNKNSKEKEIPLEFSYDEEKLKEYEEKLQIDVNQSAKNATISIQKNNIVVKPETEGRTVDINTLDKKLKENINGELNSNNQVTVDLEIIKPKITKEDLSKIKGVMGTFSSSYAKSPSGRCNNIEIATAAIKGTIVMPGEIFSFNDVVGPRTAERGYKEAGTYVGNKIEPGIGGGICQVSTTIYRAAMKANLRSIERTNHSMAVAYAEPGLDATVSYGYIDYKFKNNYDFPIYIQGNTSDKVVTYSIYGDPSGLNGRTYDMRSEILETIPPETKVVSDSSLPEGQEITEGTGMTGYKARAYQVTYENGVEVNREVVSTDIYASVGVLVKKGTQPVNGVQTVTPQINQPAQ